MAARDQGEFPNLKRVLLAEPQTSEAIRILALEMYDDGFAIRPSEQPRTGARLA